jgi:hypothetical protein
MYLKKINETSYDKSVYKLLFSCYRSTYGEVITRLNIDIVSDKYLTSVRFYTRKIN